MFIAISKSENIISYLGCNEDCNILQSDLEKRCGLLRPSPSDTTDKGYLIKTYINNDIIDICIINIDLLKNTTIWDLWE